MNIRFIYTLSLAAVWALINTGAIGAAETDNDQKRQRAIIEPAAEVSPDFGRDIMKILRRNCVACHNATDAEADVVLESPDDMRATHDQGPLLTAGDLEASRLWQVVAHFDEPIMPPEDNDVGAVPLTPVELGLLKRWIEQGAHNAAVEPPSSEIVWQPLPSAFQSIYATAVTENGTYSICARGNQLQVHDLVRGELLTTLVDAALDSTQVGQQGAAHVDRIGAIATYGEGEWIASGGYGTVKIWHRRRNSLIRELAPASPSQPTVKASSGQLLATTQGASIYLTSLVDGKQQRWNAGEPIAALAFAVDSSQLFSATADGIVRQWNTENGESNGSWRLTTSILSMAVLGNKQLVTHADRVLRVWDLTPATTEREKNSELPVLKPSRELIGHGRTINSLSASPQYPNQVLSGSDDGTMRCWNVSEGTQLQTYIHGQAINQIAVAPDQARAASVGDDGSVVLWDTHENREVARIDGDFVLARALARCRRAVAVAEANLQEANQAVQAAEKQLTKERQTLAKADQALKDSDIVARTEKMIDRLVAERASHEAILAEKQQLGRITSDDLEQARVPIISVTFSADGRQLAIGNQHHKLFIYDAHAGLPLNRYFSRANALVHASYIDAHRVATIDNQRHLIVRESQAHWILHKTLGSPKLDSPITDRVLALDFSPDGKLLAVGSGEPSRNGQISIWNVADGTRITELSQPHDDTVFALAFSPDGRHLASSSADRLMKVFQVADGQFVRSFEGHTHHALDVEWRASGKQLATSGADKQIKIWDFSSGEQLRTIDGPGKEINAISFLGTGNQLVSVSGDRQIRIHNVDDGKQVRSFSGESNYLFCCCATEIGDTIVTGGADLALRVWSTIDGKERFVFYEETVAP